MPIGPFGEVLGTTGTLNHLGENAQQYPSKVVAPRNPKLIKGQPPDLKVPHILPASYPLFFFCMDLLANCLPIIINVLINSLNCQIFYHTEI